MSYSGRTGDPQDPLEKYRQALRRQNPTGFGPMDSASEPVAPERPLVAEELPAAEEPLELDEPLELGQPPSAEEPLELGEPLAAEDPIELEDLAAADETPEFGEPLATGESPAAEKRRTAADWLGLDEELGAEDPLGLGPELSVEDPLGLDDPVALETPPPAALETPPPAAPEATPGAVAADDDLPDELQDTLARYQKAMSKMRASRRGAEAADPLAAPRGASGGPPARSEPQADGGNELLDRYLEAVDRQKIEPADNSRTSAGSARTPTVSRETLNQFRKRRTERPETPVAEPLVLEDPVPDPPMKPRAGPKARQRARPAPRAAAGWRVRAVTFAILLFAALPVQWLVYTRLGATFALEDLGAGLSALLPAALILLLARPVSGKGQLVMVLGSTAVALIGSAGFAYGLTLLQNQLPQGASLLFGLLLTLGLFTAVWGPLFLILVPVLSRMSLPARSRP